MGIDLKRVFLKHLMPHVRHSPFLERRSRVSELERTTPVALISPKSFMVVVVVVGVVGCLVGCQMYRYLMCFQDIPWNVWLFRSAVPCSVPSLELRSPDRGLITVATFEYPHLEHLGGKIDDFHNGQLGNHSPGLSIYVFSCP